VLDCSAAYAGWLALLAVLLLTSWPFWLAGYSGLLCSPAGYFASLAVLACCMVGYVNFMSGYVGWLRFLAGWICCLAMLDILAG